LWQVVEVEESSLVHLEGKVKFPRGVVVFSGSFADAAGIVLAAYPGSAVIGATVTAGYSGTATAGYSGTATAGEYGTATAGEYGTVEFRYWEVQARRYRLVVGYPGEGGVEPGKRYKLDAAHKFVEATPADE
jgi:hypothetical protein